MSVMLLSKKPPQSLSAFSMKLSGSKILALSSRRVVAHSITSRQKEIVPSTPGFRHCYGDHGCHLMSALHIQKGLGICSNFCKANNIHQLNSNPFSATVGASYRPRSSITATRCSVNRGDSLAWNRLISCKQTNCDSFSYLLNRHRQEQSSGKTNMMVSQIFKKFMSTIQEQASKSLSGGSIGSSGSGVPMEDDQDSLLADAKGNKSIKINACGKLYAELCKTKPVLFSGAPKDRGIDFDVQYYDSLDLLTPNNQDSATSSRPVVCLLHGAPGHYKDFAHLIKYLSKKGVRVVAPNFPNYDATFEHSFRHSPRERLDFLLEFFKAIQLNHVDLLVGHSSAVYTMFELLEHSIASPDQIKIKSLGLFSTPTYNLPPNMAVTPVRLFTLKLFDYPILRPVILALIQVFVKIQGIQNRVDKNRIDNLLIAASAVGYSDSEQMSERLKLIAMHNIPTFIVFGSNDRLIPTRCFDQLKRDLGVAGDNFVKQYDCTGNLISDVSQPHKLVDVSQFEAGGHYAFQRYFNQVNDDLYDFMKRRLTIKSDKLVTKL